VERARALAFAALAILLTVAPGAAAEQGADTALSAGAPHSAGAPRSAVADSTLARLDAAAGAALATRQLDAIFAVGEEARRLPPGRGTPRVELVAGIADVRAHDLESAVARLRAASPAGLVLVILVLAGLAVLLGVTLYAPVAACVWVAGERWRDRALTPYAAGGGLVPARERASWRAPLGLRSGLLLTVADDAVGLLAAFALAWFVYGAPGAVLAIESATRAGAIATIAGTAAGNVGALILSALAYRARGAGGRAAGFVPVSFWRTVTIATGLTVPLLLLSAGHDHLFVKIMGREPHSNAEPILEILLGPGGGWLGLAATVLTVAVSAPIVEEVVYRGVVYRAFRDRAGVPLAVLASGFVFAIAHLEVDHILPLWWIGLVLALVVERTGSLIPAIALHALYNALSLGIYLAGRGG
jgi:hypothetical protein